MVFDEAAVFALICLTYVDQGLCALWQALPAFLMWLNSLPGPIRLYAAHSAFYPFDDVLYRYIFPTFFELFQI